MRVVSFDVGIKNLAYCVIDIPGPKWCIPEWNCANLLQEAAPPQTCCHIMTEKPKRGSDSVASSRVCNKTAKWVSPDILACQPYCETHAKMQRWLIPKKCNEPSQLKKKKLEELKTEWSDIIDSGVNPYVPLKKSELLEKIIKHYESVCFRKAGPSTKVKTAGETDLVSIGRAIRRQLDSDPAILGATHVIIENQISTIASRMKTIQGMIAQYFIMRFGDDVNIEFISSHNKLKGLLSQEELENTTYKSNKSNGIEICRQFIESNTELRGWSTLFNSSKKRDDLADCFLQAIWYLKNSGSLTYDPANKIISCGKT